MRLDFFSFLLQTIKWAHLRHQISVWNCVFAAPNKIFTANKCAQIMCCESNLWQDCWAIMNARASAFYIIGKRRKRRNVDENNIWKRENRSRIRSLFDKKTWKLWLCISLSKIIRRMSSGKSNVISCAYRIFVRILLRLRLLRFRFSCEFFFYILFVSRCTNWMQVWLFGARSTLKIWFSIQRPVETWESTNVQIKTCCNHCYL